MSSRQGQQDEDNRAGKWAKNGKWNEKLLWQQNFPCSLLQPAKKRVQSEWKRKGERGKFNKITLSIWAKKQENETKIKFSRGQFSWNLYSPCHARKDAPPSARPLSTSHRPPPTAHRYSALKFNNGRWRVGKNERKNERKKERAERKETAKVFQRRRKKEAVGSGGGEWLRQPFVLKLIYCCCSSSSESPQLWGYLCICISICLHV